MANRTHTGILTFVLATGLVGCDRGRGPWPTAPSATVPLPPPVPNTGGPAYSVADVTLSGVVYEVTSAGPVPVEGVIVENGEGEYTVTDAKGIYKLRPIWVCPCSYNPTVRAGTTYLWVSKNGYTDPPNQPASVFWAPGTHLGERGWRDVTINGDTHFDVQLARE
jgi:hypothetical protein